MSDSLLVPVIVGLAVGIGLIVVFSGISISDNAKVPENHVSIVMIPEGAALQSSEHNNYEPSTIRIKVNETIRWINEDSMASSVIADYNVSDPNFVKATQDSAGNPTVESELYPDESFEYTFTKAGVYGYHSVPHPWMHGTVIVLPNLP